MKFIINLLLIIILSYTYAFDILSQDLKISSNSSKFQKESIYLKHTFFMNNLAYIKNGKEYSAGFYYKKLPALFDKYPEAHSSLKKGIKSKKMGVATLLVFNTLGLLLISNAEENKEYLSIGLGSILVGSIVGIKFDLSARNHIDRAVWLYNREIIR